MSEDTTTSEQLAEIEGQADTVQVCEGRWRTRNGEVRNVTPTPEGDGLAERWPWWDAEYGQTWGHDGRYFSGGDSPLDLVTYLGPIEPQPEPQAEPQATDYAPPEGWRLLAVGEPLQQADERVRIDGSRYVTRQAGRAVQSHERYIRLIEPQPEPQPADTVDELRSEVSYVQNLLGSEKRRVAELEELVTSLERQLAVAKAELTIAASVSQQLQIELDAAQQVPADSPELRQLRSDLADMTLDRDQYKDAYDSTFDDLLTTRETTKAEAVEAIVEWLQPVRLVDSPSLANETMQHLPQIMRHLTGLDSHAID